MKDMFYNYDHNINKKEAIQPLHYNMYDRPRNILNYDPHLHFIYNIFGDELGIEAQENSVFRLYFNLDGTVEGSTIQEFLCNNTVKFEVLTTNSHEVLYSTELTGPFLDDCICVELQSSTSGPLKCGTYNMHLCVECIENNTVVTYNLYSEKDGFLRII